MRSKTGKYVTLIAGLLVAVLAILSQTLGAHSSAVKKTVTVDLTDGHADQTDSEGNFAHFSPTSLPSPTFVTFNHEAICLFEVLFSEDDDLPGFETVDRPLTEFFRILLGAVISPNAP